MPGGSPSGVRVSPAHRATRVRGVTPGQGLHADAALDGEDPVQPGRDQQALHLRRYTAQHQPSAAAAGPPVGSHDHTESGGVPGVQFGQVQHQVADAVVDGRVQDRTGVRRAADVEAAPDDQLDVVAPDVHMRSPACVFFVVSSALRSPRRGCASRPYVVISRRYQVLQPLTGRNDRRLPPVSEPIPNSPRRVMFPGLMRPQCL